MRPAALHWRRGSAWASPRPTRAGARRAGPLASAALVALAILFVAGLLPGPFHPLPSARAAAPAPAAAQADPAALRAELEELQRRDRWLDAELERHAARLEQRERELELLERRRAQAEWLRLELPPLLDEILARLEAAVRADLPFLAGERAARLEGLRAALRDPAVAPGEGLRRLLEALLIEARYGAEVAAGEAVVDVDGAERIAPPEGNIDEEVGGDGTARLVQGRTLRLGRLAEYFLARDNARAWRLDAATGRWAPLDADGAAGLAEALSEALEMAEGRRPAGPLALPAPPEVAP